MKASLTRPSINHRRVRSVLLICSLIIVLIVWAVSKAPGVSALTPTLALGGSFVASPTSGTAPLAVQFTPSTYGAHTCIWTYGDGSPAETYTASSGRCPAVSHVYTSGGTYSVTLRLIISGFATTSIVRTDYIQVVGPTATITPSPTSGATLPDLSVVSITEFTFSIPTPTSNMQGCRPWTAGSGIGLRVTIQNTGTGNSGPFRVVLNGTSQKDATNIIAGGTTTVSFQGISLPRTRTAAVDTLNEIIESDETNNTFTLVLPAATSTSTGTPRPTFCVTTPAPITLTPSITSTITHTPTRTTSPTITRTPTRTATGPTPTRTFTPTIGPSLSPSPTMVSDVCSPVTSTISSIPFIFDGAGNFCWQASSLGGSINSWSTSSVSVNGVNVTNMWVGSGSYPAKINGFYYVSYNSAVSWGHFEARP